MGLTISRKLKERLPHGAVVTEESGDGARLMELWKGFDVVVLIDAVKSGAGPGTVHRFEAHASPLPILLFQESSTHLFGIPHAIELARAMNQLPAKLFVYGIEGECFDEGTEMSPCIVQAAQRLVESLISEILRRHPPGGQLEWENRYRGSPRDLT